MKAHGEVTRRINAKAAQFRLRIGRSALHRFGVFALEDIPRGQRVIEYTGRCVTLKQAIKIRPPEDIYLAWINNDLYLDGRWRGSGAQFINHSCKPNLVWRCLHRRLYFYSRRKLRAGEELTVKYRYPVKLRRVLCHCGAGRCRGTLRLILS